MKIRHPDEGEFLDIYEFVNACEPLEGYAEHFYRIMLRYFGNSCFVAEDEKEMVGFVMGFVSQNHGDQTFFLWQIGVSPACQGRGIGRRILNAVEEEMRESGCERIEVTVDPENAPSFRLFAKNGYRNISTREGAVAKVEGITAVRDYYSPGRHFVLFEKRL